jgi:hypothetical protein
MARSGSHSVECWLISWRRGYRGLKPKSIGLKNLVTRLDAPIKTLLCAEESGRQTYLVPMTRRFRPEGSSKSWRRSLGANEGKLGRLLNFKFPSISISSEFIIFGFGKLTGRPTPACLWCAERGDCKTSVLKHPKARQLKVFVAKRKKRKKNKKQNADRKHCYCERFLAENSTRTLYNYNYSRSKNIVDFL